MNFLYLARFAVSGGISAAAYYGVAWLVAEGLGWPLGMAGFIGYLVSMPIAYGLHRSYTFQSQGTIVKESSRFGVSSLLGIGLSTVLPVALTHLHLSVAVAFALTCVLVPIANYLLLSRWVFATASRHG